MSHPPLGPYELLPQGERRRLVAGTALRMGGVAAVLVTAYFVLPFDRLGDARYLAGFLLGAVAVVGVLLLQFRSTIRAPYPGLRALEGALTTATLFVVVFATAHFEVGALDADSYSQRLTRLDALYFAMTTFATVGYGDIAPASEFARGLTLLQMTVGLILVGLIAKILLGVARDQAGRRVTTRLSSDRAADDL